ncbi:MAG: hypothetical protein J6Y78_00290 [Paludibacteraceae bacterium]|nr:hypothetical protein [Paludibacteraceae bacterium]
MRDYQKYINALRKCAKEHENDTTYTGHIIISDLCRDTANLLEALEQEPITVDTITEYCKEHNYVLCEKGTEHGYMLVCPNCGLDVHSDFKTCPRCGAKMKVGE